MSDLARDRAQRIFLLKCSIFSNFKDGNFNLTIREIFQDAGISHYSVLDCASLLGEVIQDPLIQIRTVSGSLVIDPSFSLEQQVIISTNPLYEQSFIDFVNERIGRTIEALRMSPIELRRMESIRDEGNFITKLQQLAILLRQHPRPYFF